MSSSGTCPICANTEFTFQKDVRAIRAPTGEELPYEAEYSKCTRCGEEFFSRMQSRAASRAASAALRVHQGLLTPAEIIEIREKHGLTQDQLQTVLGLGKKTVVRWEAGTVNQSRAADLLLRQLRDGTELIEKLLTAKNGVAGVDEAATKEWAIAVAPVGSPIEVVVEVTEGRNTGPKRSKSMSWKLRKIRSSRLARIGVREARSGGLDDCELLTRVG